MMKQKTFPSTLFVKLGPAAVFILAAAIGNQLRKERAKYQLIGLEGNVNKYMEAAFNKDGSDSSKKQLLICKLLKKIRTLPEKIVSKDEILKIYAQTSIKKCNSYLSSDADNWVSKREEEYLDWMDTSDNWPPPASLRPPPRPKYQEVLMAAVKTLWCLSCRKTLNSVEYVDLPLLHLLKEVSSASTEIAVKQEVIRIMANLCTHAQYHQLIQEADWIEKLSELSKESHPILYLPAWRALHNLKNHSTSRNCTNITEKSQEELPIYNEGIYPYVPPNQDVENASVDIILVHGINGGASWTFRQHDKHKHKPIITQGQRAQLYTQTDHIGLLDNLYTWCWPADWLMPQLTVNARILALNYESHWFTWEDKNTPKDQGCSIAENSLAMTSVLKDAGVGKRPIIWITHSMGGLIVKDILANKESATCNGIRSSKSDLLSSTRGIVFLSVPHRGSRLASQTAFFSALFKPTKGILQLVENSSDLVNLQKMFEEVMKDSNISILSLNETEPMKNSGFEVIFVEPYSADIGIGSFHEIENATHMDICKLESRESKAFKIILKYAQEVLKNL